jgi:hypothetical protein
VLPVPAAAAIPAVPLQQAVAEWATPVRRHQYGLGIILIALECVLDGGQSFYASAWVLQLLSYVGDGVEEAPSYASIRLWLLRVGLYKLSRPLEKADDWIWIVDHTMQCGDRKCLIILGLRGSVWQAAPDRRLRREDVEVIALEPVCESTGEIVAEQLRQAAQRCGIPRAIVSDDGRDLHRGLALYGADHPGTGWIYDIKHQTAALLKRTLEGDPQWTAFAQQATRTKQQVYLTPLAFLAPPQQRGKARYMNVDTLVAWGRKVLAFLEDPQASARHHLAREEVEAKLGWLRTYRAVLQSWAEALQVIEVTEHYVRTEGIHRRAVAELRSQLQALGGGPLSGRFRDTLLASLRQHVRLCRPGERLPGSSEIIESVIGQYKHLQGERSPHGLTAMVLSIAANVGERSAALVRTALEQISTSALFQWCRTHLGSSVQSHRKTAFSGLLKGTKMATIPSQ